MGFFDNLRERFSGNDDYYDDDYDDDYYEDDTSDDDRGSGLLGNTPRPEAESVSVYTRSGRPVTTSTSSSGGYEGQGSDGGSYSSGYRGQESGRASRPAASSVDEGRGATRMNASGQLPAYILHPASYEDVQTVVRRVKTNQPVVLVLDEIDGAVATRILDFCYGLSFGIDGQIQQLSGRTFAVVPKGLEISQADRDKLAANGDLEG